MRRKLKIGSKSKHWVYFRNDYYEKVPDEEKWYFFNVDNPYYRRYPCVVNMFRLQELGIVGKSVNSMSYGPQSDTPTLGRIYYFDTAENKTKFIMRYC